MREIMTSPAITVPAHAKVAEAAESMVEQKIGSVVVVDRDNPSRVAGIVTQTDLELRDERVPHAYPTMHAPRLLDRWVQTFEQLEAALASAATRPVTDVMSSPVRTVEADADIWVAARLMLEHDIKRLPVMEHKKLVGIVVRHDLLKAMVAIGREGG